METYKSGSFYRTFKKVGIQKGDLLLIHNSLFSFGFPNDIPLKDLPAKIYSDLCSIIGEEGTLAVPTFNFDFCKGIPYNKQKAPSRLMGVFSEYVRTLPSSRRSSHPMQSIAVIGKLRDEIIETDTASAFGVSGPFDKLLKYHCKMVLLGTGMNSASFVHLAEERLKVPYRYWKNFEGEYIDGDYMSKKTYKMFVRDLKANPKLNMEDIALELEQSNQIKKAKIGAGSVNVFSARDFLDIAKRNIAKNPYYYVSNHPKYLQK